MEVRGLLRDSIMASTNERSMAKESKGFKKLPTHTQTMILRASEPALAGYANSQGILTWLPLRPLTPSRSLHTTSATSLSAPSVSLPP
jgi:hypothetical protein